MFRSVYVLLRNLTHKLSTEANQLFPASRRVGATFPGLNEPGKDREKVIPTGDLFPAFSNKERTKKTIAYVIPFVDSLFEKAEKITRGNYLFPVFSRLIQGKVCLLNVSTAPSLDKGT